MLARERSSAARLILVTLVAMTSRAGLAQSPGQGDAKKAECGSNALFILLHLEGRPVTLDRLERSLPPQNPDGYSMAELSTASSSLGLDLEGVRIGKGDRPLDRPAIAFLKHSQGGHFVVMRPVGSTGTRVQVIDPPYSPWVVDYRQIFDSNQWTGAILVPREPHHLLGMLGAASALFVAVAVAAGSLLRSRRRSRRLPNQA